MCGAEYVQKSHNLPSNFVKNAKSCSFDGDADRLIYL